MEDRQYAYSYNLGSAFMGTFDSVEEALADADENYDKGETDILVHVGYVTPIDLSEYAPDLDCIIDHMMEAAYDDLHENLYEELWDKMEELGDGACRVLTERIKSCIEKWQEDFQIAPFQKIVGLETYTIRKTSA